MSKMVSLRFENSLNVTDIADTTKVIILEPNTSLKSLFVQNAYVRSIYFILAIYEVLHKFEHERGCQEKV